MEHIPTKIIADAATSPAARRAVLLARTLLLPTKNEVEVTTDWCPARAYKMAIAAAVLLCRPANFMEIGVRRGHALATAAILSPGIDLLGFDLWIENYGGESNLGPAHVRQELKRIGHAGDLLLIPGNSVETVPIYQASFPDVKYDLIGVDGSHAAVDAEKDLATALKMLAPGGILIFDDIVHPFHADLLQVWRTMSEGYERHEVTDYYGFGLLRKTI